MPPPLLHRAAIISLCLDRQPHEVAVRTLCIYKVNLKLQLKIFYLPNINRMQAAVSVHCRHLVTPGGDGMVLSAAA